jgi:hypothetical protein
MSGRSTGRTLLMCQPIRRHLETGTCTISPISISTELDTALWSYHLFAWSVEVPRISMAFSQSGTWWLCGTVCGLVALMYHGRTLMLCDGHVGMGSCAQKPGSDQLRVELPSSEVSIMYRSAELRLICKLQRTDLIQRPMQELSEVGSLENVLMGNPRQCERFERWLETFR